jgi:hypothetical protein
MSELQDKLDRGEITLDAYHARWVAEMEENERLHPGIHDRLYEYLMAKYPGPGVEADTFFGLEESDGVSTKASSGPSANS